MAIQYRGNIQTLQGMANIRLMDQETQAKKIENVSSFMDLQQKIRMLPTLKNQTKAAEIESRVALDRAKARGSLLTPDKIAKQEEVLLEIEESDTAMKQRTQDMAAIAQFQGPITTSNFEKFKQHLKESKVDLEKFGFDDSISPAEAGVLKQMWSDTYIATQKQLQAKDLMDVQQQMDLDKMQRQQFYAMQQNLQKYQFDLDLQQRSMQNKERIAMAAASGAEIPTKLTVWEDHKEFGDTFSKAMVTRFPNAEWTKDADTLANLSGEALRIANQLANQAQIDYRAGRGGLPNSREYYMEEAINTMMAQIDNDGVYHADPESAKLKQDFEKFAKAARANPDFENMFRATNIRAGGTLTEEDFLEWMWSQGTFRGYTPDDPFDTGKSVFSNIPIRMRQSRSEEQALPAWMSRGTF